MHSPRYPTTPARKALAKRFKLFYHDGMQDWEWEIADVSRFSEFLAAYRSAELTIDERFSLMEIMIQCVDEMPDEESFSNAWQAIESHLISGMAIHSATVEYWSRLDEHDPDPDAYFRVTPKMRELLPIQQPRSG